MSGDAKGFMDQETEMCLATVRPDGRPHAVPLAFVYETGNVYFLTSKSRSVTVRNIARNPYAVAVIHRDEKAVIVEGPAGLVKDLAEVERLRGLFLEKYPHWSDLRDPDLPGRVLVQVKAHKTLSWGV